MKPSPNLLIPLFLLFLNFPAMCKDQRAHTFMLQGGYAFAGFRDERVCSFPYTGKGFGFVGGYRLERGKSRNEFRFDAKYTFRETFFDEPLWDRLDIIEYAFDYGYHYHAFNTGLLTWNPGLVIDYDHSYEIEIWKYWLTTMSANISLQLIMDMFNRLRISVSAHTPLVTFLNRVPWTGLHYKNMDLEILIPVGTTGSETMIRGYNSIAMDMSVSLKLNRRFNLLCNYRFMFKHVKGIRKLRTVNSILGTGVEFNFSRKRRTMK